MKLFSVRIFFFLAVFTNATFATTVKQAPEPMSFEEKLALYGETRRSLRQLQSRLTYKGQICRAETKGILSCRTAGTQCLSNQWDYWKLNLQAGVAYTIEVDRVTCGLDPAFALFEGTGTTVPDGCFFDGISTDELTWIAAADDDDLEPAYCPLSSPFADPKLVVTPSASGAFTLAVVNFVTDIATCSASAGYQYKIKISPRPLCV